MLQILLDKMFVRATVANSQGNKSIYEKRKRFRDFIEGKLFPFYRVYSSLLRITQQTFTRGNLLKFICLSRSKMFNAKILNILNIFFIYFCAKARKQNLIVLKLFGR